MTEATAFTPDWVSPPGDTIADLLEERGWSQAELASRTGYTTKHVNDLIQGRAHIQPETAERLSLVLGSTSAFWLVREAQYRAAEDRRRSVEAHRGDAGWLAELPLAWMISAGWVRRFRHKGEQVAECLRYFRTASVAAWREQYEQPLVAYRASSKFQKRIGAVATWLRQAEILADSVETKPFEKDAFRQLLAGLRALSREPMVTTLMPTLVASCAACGVAVVVVPAPPGCPVSGATRFLGSDRAMLVVSLRHKSNDHFWFTFFHEAAHLVLHGKKLRFVEGIDGLDSDLEAEADRFARDLLIPPGRAAELRELRTEQDVIAFADRLGIAPGVVVGRLQNEKRIGWNRLNHLKVRMPA